jgi:hypothetical protein
MTFGAMCQAVVYYLVTRVNSLGDNDMPLVLLSGRDLPLFIFTAL